MFWVAGHSTGLLSVDSPQRWICVKWGALLLAFLINQARSLRGRTPMSLLYISLAMFLPLPLESPGKWIGDKGKENLPDAGMNDWT